MQSLLEAGAHFGHQAQHWHPQMKKYIFAERNGIHIINLQKTIIAIREAFEVVRQTVLARKTILFVGTKKQAQKTIEREATKCGMYYANYRWLGGILTNFSTIQLSINHLKKIEKMNTDGLLENMGGKEASRLKKKAAALERNLGGIKEMHDLPGLLFIIDPARESIALAEAKRMNIPVIAVVDTNCNPQDVTHPIPGNDDAIRSISLFTEIISQAVIDADNEIGLEVIETLQDNQGSSIFDSDADTNTDNTTVDYLSQTKKYDFDFTPSPEHAADETGDTSKALNIKKPTSGTSGHEVDFPTPVDMDIDKNSTKISSTHETLLKLKKKSSDSTPIRSSTSENVLLEDTATKDSSVKLKKKSSDSTPIRSSTSENVLPKDTATKDSSEKLKKKSSDSTPIKSSTSNSTKKKMRTKKVDTSSKASKKKESTTRKSNTKITIPETEDKENITEKTISNTEIQNKTD